MTHITLDDGSVLRVATTADTLLQALGGGSGKVGVQDGDTWEWRWVPVASIRAIDGRPWLGRRSLTPR